MLDPRSQQRNRLLVVDEAPNLEPPIPLGRMIAVYSPKGGVGCSVLACNLAVALRRTLGDARVVLVDADLEAGNAHVLLNLNSPMCIDDLLEVGRLDARILAGVLALHESGVQLLRAPITRESAARFTADNMRAILTALREHCDYLVVDCADTFSASTRAVLELADQILLVSTLEVPTIFQISRLLELLQDQIEVVHKLRLVCNRVVPSCGLRPAQVEAALRRRFIAGIPEDHQRVVTSVNQGVPFVLAEEQTPVSRAVCALAWRVVELGRAAAQQPEAQLPAGADAPGRRATRRGGGRGRAGARGSGPEAAWALLCAVLTPEEYQQLTTLGYLEVPSPGRPERVYRIPAARGRVSVRERGREVMQLCLVPAQPLPRSDVIVLHKLLIQGDEEEYLRIANHFPLHPAAWM